MKEKINLATIKEQLSFDKEYTHDVTYLGLNDEEVTESRKIYGINKLTEKKKRNKILKLIDQFRDPMIVILLLASIISYFTGDKVESIIIVSIVILNAIIGYTQESKAETSLDALKEMSSANAKVFRNGKEIEIGSHELVVGDLIILETGDVISADIRLTNTVSLKIQEAALTGESIPVYKQSDYVGNSEDKLGDRKNMAYSSALVTYGRAQGIVVAVGMDTEVGKIAKLIQEDVIEKTPLQKQLGNLGKKLGYFSLVACTLIFILAVIKDPNDILGAFMMAVSLAVAVIPEGLPAIATIVLAMGVRNLVEKHAIIRTLPSVETLGSATVICSDKTGTLTQNKMVVKDTFVTSNNIEKLALYSLLCNDSRFIDNHWEGDPTETALSEWVQSQGMDTSKMMSENPRINELPFDSKRKTMSTLNLINGKKTIICKGGVDEVLENTTHIVENKQIVRITDEHRIKILEENKKMAQKALRVLAFSYREINDSFENFDLENENSLIFTGLIGMIDPPREQVVDAIKICNQAGIRTIMITGDHAITATSIANEIGLLKDYKVVTGKELDLMSDKELYKNVDKIGVYARVTPEDKMRIIEALKSRGHVVAMTGDGVNDAPALKRADIGAAMGIVGTEVAKEASDMILTDDNFSTIVNAVEEGRRIKDNILKSVNYLLSCNVGELLTLLVAILFNLGLPLLPIHILWVNLVTDSLPALALGVDPAESNIMERKPEISSNLLTKSDIYRITYQGIMIGCLTLFAFMYGSGMLWNSEGNESMGQTMAFTVLALSQLVHAYNIHSPQESVFKTFLKNKWLLLGTFINSLMMLSVLMIPPLRNLFMLDKLDMQHWSVIIVLVISPLFIVEIMKKLKLNGN